VRPATWLSLYQEVRDPRFSQLSGEFDATKHRNHYGFLSDMRESELGMLRDNLKRARKLLASSPRHLRPEREAEVERLVLAVKRAESSVNRDKRERVEQEALSAISREERNKRQKGKKAFWLKNCGSFHHLHSWPLKRNSYSNS
jgi:ribosomal RNA-processing protein 36